MVIKFLIISTSMTNSSVGGTVEDHIDCVQWGSNSLVNSVIYGRYLYHMVYNNLFVCHMVDLFTFSSSYDRFICQKYPIWEQNYVLSN